MAQAIEILSFIVEWKEPCAAVPREFLLSYYPRESCVSLYDIKRRKPFLRKIECPTVSLKNIYIGNHIEVLSRDLLIKSYANEPTEKFFKFALERTLAGVTEHGFNQLGAILTEISKTNLLVRNLKMLTPTEDDTKFFLKWLGDLSKKMVRDNIQPGRPVLLMELDGYDCVAKWQGLTSSMSHMTFGSANQDCVRDELNILFSHNRPLHCNTAVFSNSTCCIIKPHIILSNLAGNVISFITERFTISAIEMFTLTRVQADNFFQLYKGVLPYYNELLDEMTLGPCLVMEITSSGGENTQQTFREFVGPHDSQLAKQARPYSLRAYFGIDRIRNAVHCTDLPEDAVLEIEYFFRILPKYVKKERI